MGDAPVKVEKKGKRKQKAIFQKLKVKNMKNGMHCGQRVIH